MNGADRREIAKHSAKRQSYLGISFPTEVPVYLCGAAIWPEMYLEIRAALSPVQQPWSVADDASRDL